MILFEKNPNLPLKVITTASGKKEYRRNCRYIKERYYLMESECFLINNKWYRKDSDKVEYDHEKKQYVLRTNTELIHGIVDFTENKTPILGYFSPNIYNNVNCSNVSVNMAINKEILQANDYIEDVGTCRWYPSIGLSSSQIAKLQSIRNEVDHHRKGYNIEDNRDEYEFKKKAYKFYDTSIAPNVRRYAKFLGDSTFGAEIETYQGNMPNNLQNQNGIVICRDGSIESAEYVTVPMEGTKGVQTLVNIAKELSKRTRINMSCSVHYHFGNVSIDRLSLIVFYILAYKIQDDIFKMFPYYKTDCRNLKRKNYCQKLKKMAIQPLVDCSKEGYDSYIEEVYVKIFTFLSCGTPPGEGVNRDQLRHPFHNKWEIFSRYFWLNLVNTIFSPRKTVEFRIFTPSLNPYKYTAWLYMANAFIKFAEHNAEKILTAKSKISFIDVLNYYKSSNPENEDAAFLSEYLIAFYNHQKEVFERDFKNNDFISEHDISKDDSFEFKLNNKCLF